MAASPSRTTGWSSARRMRMGLGAMNLGRDPGAGAFGRGLQAEHVTGGGAGARHSCSRKFKLKIENGSLAFE